jgi:hypothetical protein
MIAGKTKGKVIMNERIEVGIKPSESEQLTTYFLSLALFGTLLKKGVITESELSDVFDDTLGNMDDLKTDDSAKVIELAQESITSIRETIFSHLKKS